MGFVGINPDELLQVADAIDRCACGVLLSRRSLAGALERAESGDGDRVPATLDRVVTSLNDESELLRWRAMVISDSRSVAATALPDIELFAAKAVFTADSWQTAYHEWRVERIAGSPSAASPRQVADLFAFMSAHEIDAVVTSHPDLVGRLDGAPPRARFAANRVLIAEEILRLRRHFEMLSAQSEAGSRIGGALAEHIADRIDEYQRWLDEGRKILLFDPRGDGRVVEVFGDLEAADRIAVVIPGMGNDITNFSTAAGGFRADAGDLFAAIADPGVATIAWLGYDTPDHVGAAVRSAAEAGAPSLQRFLHGVDPSGQRHITVVAHSYGSVLAGVAARSGIEADDLVFVGSPGTTLDRAADAQLREDGVVWAALADGDIIASAISPSEQPPSWIPVGLWPVWIGINRWSGAAAELWHGANPVGDRFGAIEFTTDGCRGHSEYYEAGSLVNLAKIVTGRDSEVSRSD